MGLYYFCKPRDCSSITIFISHCKKFNSEKYTSDINGILSKSHYYSQDLGNNHENIIVTHLSDL